MLDRRIAALGRPFSLGQLFDVRTNELGLSFIHVQSKDEPTAGKADVEYVPPNSPVVKIINDDSLRTKLSVLNNDQVDDCMLELALGLIQPSGSGDFLSNVRRSPPHLRSVLYCSFLSKRERLTKDHFRNLDGLDALCNNDIGTHVVSAIGYGLHFFLVLDFVARSGQPPANAGMQLEAIADILRQLILQPQRRMDQLPDIARDVTVTVHSDLETSHSAATGLSIMEASDYCRALPVIVSKRIKTSALPKSIWLDSLSSLNSKIQRMEVGFSPKMIDNVVDAVSHLEEEKIQLNYMLKHTIYSKFSRLRASVHAMVAETESKKTRLKEDIAGRLNDIKRGDVHPKILEAIMERYRSSELSQPSVKEWIECRMRENDHLHATMKTLGQFEFIASPEGLDNFFNDHSSASVVCFVVNPTGENREGLTRMYHPPKNRDSTSARSRGAHARRVTTYSAQNARPGWFTWSRQAVAEAMKQEAQNYWSYATANPDVRCIVVQSAEATNDLFETVYYINGKRVSFELPLPVEDFQVTDASGNSISLKWKSPAASGSSGNKKEYLVTYRETNKSPRQPDNKWIPFGRPLALTNVTIDHLNASTAYDFSVSTIGAIGTSRAKFLKCLHTLDPFTVAEPPSSVSKTSLKPVKNITHLVTPLPQEKPKAKRYIDVVMDGAQLLTAGKPNVFALQLTELGCDAQKKIRRYHVGPKTPSNETSQEKVVLLMGKTGAGKTTLINGLVNYMLGVKFDDPVRFKLIVEVGESEACNQTKSMTQWVSSYQIPKRADCPYPFSLNIIDTPGMGDTSGIQRDFEIHDQLKAFFGCADPSLAIDRIDAVGLVIPSSSVRLDATQKYILQSILSVFGKDIMNNMFLLLTFADHKKPHALIEGVEKETGIKFSSTCKFNNCALYENNEADADPFTKSYWHIGATSMEEFFTTLVHTQPQSLVLTREVLEERERIHIQLEGIMQSAAHIRGRMDTIRANERQLEQTDISVQANANHTVEVEVEEVVRHPHPGGPRRFVTNCRVCNFTCHSTCSVEKDDKKKRCRAMDKKTGYCKVCPKQCEWTHHSNTPYIYVYQKKKVPKVLNELLQRFNMFSSTKTRIEAFLADSRKRYRDLEVEQQINVKKLREAYEKLNEIAVVHNGFSMIDYYDQCIEEEKGSKRPDYEKQLQFLQKEREKEIISLKVKRGDRIF